jgi:two-component system response regulator MprA
VQAADGSRAFGLLTSEPFSVAVVDVMMPGIDGLTLCRMLREAPAAGPVKVLIVSAAVTEAQALAAGADAFLSKPFRPSALRSMVSALVVAGDGETRLADDVQRAYDGRR